MNEQEILNVFSKSSLSEWLNANNSEEVRAAVIDFALRVLDDKKQNTLSNHTEYKVTRIIR